jgi:hypothetical protein
VNWTAPQVALVTGASISHRAQGGADLTGGLACRGVHRSPSPRAAQPARPGAQEGAMLLAGSTVVLGWRASAEAGLSDMFSVAEVLIGIVGLGRVCKVGRVVGW